VTARQVYAIGVDQLLNGAIPDAATFNPANGPGGIFAGELQGFTPKYALNQGPRETQQKNTMARMYVSVPNGERTTFASSITDPNLRQYIVPRLIGPGSQEATDTGYMDFFLQQIQSPLQEKYQVVETLSDNYVAYFFGQSAPVWQYSGELLNTVQDDQLSAWVRMYVAILRGTQLARRGKVVSLRYDNFIVTGTIVNTSWVHNAQNEMRISFNFSLLVKRVYVVNFTAGWRPTPVNGSFTVDPHLVVANTTSDQAPQAAVVQGSGATNQSGSTTPPGQSTGPSTLVTSLPAGSTGATQATNPNQNGGQAEPAARAQQRVTGQPAEAQGVQNAPAVNTSLRPQDNPPTQEITFTEDTVVMPGRMSNGHQAPRNLQSVTR
jgi:hypothetical protein